MERLEEKSAENWTPGGKNGLLRQDEVVMAIERGNHEELLSEKGRYYQLYTDAFETADDMESETA